MPKEENEHQFTDPSGLIIHVEHILVPLNIEGPQEGGTGWKKEIFQQPSSRLTLELPAKFPLSAPEIFEAVAGEKPPKDFAFKNGNQLSIGTVVTTLDQVKIIGALTESGLFEKSTLEQVNDCCNNPRPRSASMGLNSPKR